MTVKLFRQIDELTAEVQKLTQENQDLRVEVEHWQCEDANGVALIKMLSAEVDQLRTMTGYEAAAALFRAEIERLCNENRALRAKIGEQE